MSAHRLDEYLQAARFAIEPARVEISLDLTPGMAVAAQVLREIDTDGDGAIAPAEQQAYASEVLGAASLEMDGRPLRLELTDSSYPGADAMLQGQGTIRLRMQASIPRLGDGMHELRYRTTHRPDISVYLANALVPASHRVTIESQRRDPDQRDITIRYLLIADGPSRARSGAGVFAAMFVIFIAAARRRRHPPSTTTP